MTGRNRRKNRSRNTEEKIERKHIVLPEVVVSRIKEPRPVCSICGEPIGAIIEAISEPDGSYSHFDCVINRLREKYRVTEPDKISYIGHGNFAVFTKDEEGKFVIREKINYESNESYSNMLKYVEENRK
ncbi:MAG: hypothetical protein K5634_04495 [Sphaerochaetaceae bacterium]|nr:hypothetical protein [Sphaerochaetaceae bacterium]